MADTMGAKQRAVSSTAEETAMPLRLHTGYFDDRREAIAPGDRRYALFARARTEQDSWDDDSHCDFWLLHLDLWRGTPGNSSNREALAFVLVLGRVEGLSFEETVATLPGRVRSDLRDRVFPIAKRMWETVQGKEADVFEVAGVTLERATENGRTLLGPAHPDVIRALRLWRLPRVFADDPDGREEAVLPPPLAGFINLPAGFGRPTAFEAIGDASLSAIDGGCAALNERRSGVPVTHHVDAVRRERLLRELAL